MHPAFTSLQDRLAGLEADAATKIREFDLVSLVCRTSESGLREESFPASALVRKGPPAHHSIIMFLEHGRHLEGIAKNNPPLISQLAPRARRQRQTLPRATSRGSPRLWLVPRHHRYRAPLLPNGQQLLAPLRRGRLWFRNPPTERLR